MKTAELREKTIEQLYKDLTAAREQLQQLRFKSVFREVGDTTAKEKTRRDIARLLTIIREKEVERLIAQEQ